MGVARVDCKLSGERSLGITMARPMVLARLMETHIWHHWNLYAVWEEGSTRKLAAASTSL